MTQPEQKSINAIGFKQATMEANQINMADDITEMKQDIKEIKELLRASSSLYVTKKFATGFASVVISIATLWVLFLNYVHNIK